MNLLNRLGQILIFLPTIFCFSYLLRPLLMMILIPGGLCLLAILGGKEVRRPLYAMLKTSLWPTSNKTKGRVMKRKQSIKRVNAQEG
ncbi:hypothetical protein AB4179_23815 [Vibrio lentus]|nr:hypothetical protein [Vibrio lentus]OBT00539.1 hypothetical protein A9261_00235 [Vibrio tasmaniensis]PMG18611.1 hypothetical protein BCU96_10325 [Vibrio lentus]PMH04871.1 hypothetical protein BCU76_11795 [Vibrio lentus]PMH25486.1 hypothetical protein BCU71_24280 [Vibrio lentus]PMJ10939.1 hypothetical protein BCU30_19865 [Vibrio lentus]